MFRSLLILIHYQCFLHFTTCIQETIFELRNIIWVIYHILEHLKRSERCTILAKYDIMLIVFVAFDALPDSIPLQYVHKVHFLIPVSEAVKHKLAR